MEDRSKKKHSKWLFWPKMAKFRPFLAILGVKNFSTNNIFGGHLSYMETQLHAKNEKKILRGQGCRTGTDVRTDVLTHKIEFIGSFWSLKTSGEPKNHQRFGRKWPKAAQNHIMSPKAMYF